MSKLSTHARAEYDRGENRRRKAAGLCAHCPQLANPGKAACESCRVSRNAKAIRLREQRKGKACYTCSRPTEGSARCAGCQLKNLTSVNKSSAKHVVNPRTQRVRLRRIECVQRYGGCCAHCKETTPAFLNIDHIQGGGNQHRKMQKIWSIAVELKRLGWPEGYQVLCFNCNHRKWLVEARRSLSTNPNTIKTRAKTNRERTLLFEKYGNQCACCQLSDHDVLTIDHVDNGGAAERKRFRNKVAFYQSLLNQPRSPRYRILCFNCNSGRAVNGGVCPHK